MVDKLRVFHIDDLDELDAMVGVDRSQIGSTATVKHLGNADVEYTYSCGHVVPDVIRDRYGKREPDQADFLVAFVTEDGIPLDCPKCDTNRFGK